MNISSFSPLQTLRRSFKRNTACNKEEIRPTIVLTGENSAGIGTTTTNVSPQQPQRSLSVKRLPFSTIRSANGGNDKHLNNNNSDSSLPNSPKQIQNFNFNFVRSSHKTSSFHNYRRYTR